MQQEDFLVLLFKNLVDNQKAEMCHKFSGQFGQLLVKKSAKHSIKPKKFA